MTPPSLSDVRGRVDKSFEARQPDAVLLHELAHSRERLKGRGYIAGVPRSRAALDRRIGEPRVIADQRVRNSHEKLWRKRLTPRRGWERLEALFPLREGLRRYGGDAPEMLDEGIDRGVSDVIVRTEAVDADGRDALSRDD